jgi:hypothetical protein
MVLASIFNCGHLVKVLQYIQRFRDNTCMKKMFTAIVQSWILEGIDFSKMVNQGPPSYGRIFIRYSTILDSLTLCDVWLNWILDRGSTSLLYTMDLVDLSLWGWGLVPL